METVKQKLENILEENGFRQVEVSGTRIYLFRDHYYKLTYIEGLKAFVLECAEDEFAVKNNVFEDSDLYPLALGEEGMSEKLQSDLLEYYNGS
ncbi:MAG: hypothetical protein ACQEXQ_29575 [Bacillota bacterium]